LDWLSHSDSPWRVLALPKKWFKRRPERTQPVRFRLALEELGTTYIKLGQAISTRTDLLPQEYVEELSKLQDAAPSIPYTEVRDVIIEELGEPPETLFREFCREPEAAASIGQAHRAQLHDGTRVVVKVQRPGAAKKVQEDLLVLHDVASFLTTNTKLGKQYDFLGWLEEFAYTISNELDFRREGRNADRIRENFLSDPDLHAARIHWQYTTRRVITMEDIRGIKLSDTDSLDEAGIDRMQLSRTCARIVLSMIFRHGFFHADPHPGNFFVLPNGSIGLIDFGMVGRLNRNTRESLMRVTLSVSKNDAEGLQDELLVLGVPRGPVRRQDLRLDLDKIIQTYTEGPPEDFSLAHMFNDILATAARHRIHVPSDLLFLAKTIAMCEGLSAMLDPNFNLMSFTRSFLENYAGELRERKAVTERLQEGAIDLADLALSFPRKARRLFGQFERGEIAITARLENADQLLDHVHIAANRLSMAVIMASLIVGMSYVVTRQESRGTTSILLQIMLALAVVGGIALLVSIWRSKRH
jgi:ubiquinone biosynthesis protein